MRHLYDRTAPALALLCLVVALGAAAGSYWNDRVNDRQDDQRIADTAARAADNTRLLDCFDDFATSLAGGLPKVREASALRNEAQSKVFAQLEALLSAALAKPPLNEEQSAQIIAGLAKALADYREADAHLLAVQAANPYPDPPSRFCNDLP